MRKFLWLIPLLMIFLIQCGSEEPYKPAQLGEAGKRLEGAPPLQDIQWIKGEPVKLGRAGGANLYVVEFWATWCPPCRRSIPHLTELRKKYQSRGVVFVGISDEPLEDVRPYVEGMGEKMDYAVGVDRHGVVTNDYLTARQIDTLPHVFIVDGRGAIRWHGNTLDGLDEAIEANLKK